MDIGKASFNFYWKAQKVIAPALRYSQSVYEDVLFSHTEGVSVWLDLGCGHQILPSWRLEQERALAGRPRLLVGFDFDEYSLRRHRTIGNLVRGDISRLPFQSETFDLVTSNMVFEHLKSPAIQLAEIFRILKPEGRLIFHTPNSRSYLVKLARLFPDSLKTRIVWILQRRREEDVFPTFYRINTEEKIRRLAEELGFRVQELHMISSVAESSRIPLLGIFELFWIRLLMTHPMRKFRTNVIAVLAKPGTDEGNDV